MPKFKASLGYTVRTYLKFKGFVASEIVRQAPTTLCRVLGWGRTGVTKHEVGLKTSEGQRTNLFRQKLGFDSEWKQLWNRQD